MASNSIDSDMLSQVEQYITTIHRQLRIPGLAIAIVQDQKIIYQRSLGEAAPGRPTTPSTPFILGSLSKSFTALAIMQLIEQSKVKLNAPVQQYIPWFQVDGHTGSVRSDILSAQITIRHLLCHISGLPRYEGRDLLSGSGGKTLEQVVRELRFVKLIKPIGITELVGSKFQYSNLNYAVLGYLLEIASGQSYSEYLQQHIFEPLNMHESFTAEQDELAQGYRWWFGFPLPYTAPYLTEAVPAAFVISSTEDMAKYLIACLNAGKSDGALLSPKGFEEMYAPQGLMKRDDNFNYGFGWRTGLYHGEKMLRHGGEVSNFRADMVMLPERKLGIVVLANCNNGMIAQLGLDQIAMNVVWLLLGQPLPRKQLTFCGFYALVNLLVVAISLLQIGSLVQLLRSLFVRRRPTRVGISSFLAMIGDVLGSVVLLWQLPRLADMPWNGLFKYVPDMSRWIAGMSVVSLVKICVRVYRWLRLR